MIGGLSHTSIRRIIMENEDFVPTIKITDQMKIDAFYYIRDLCYDGASEYAFDDDELIELNVNLSIVKSCMNV
jgi:hypothetical protein